MPAAINPMIKARNAEIIEARRNGTASLGQLAAKFEISRERVRQIAEKAGVDRHAASSAYRRHKDDDSFDRAQEHASAILMRFIAGDLPAEIAHTTGLQLKSVQEVLDEQVTDQVIAARSNNRAARNFPGVGAGPRIDSEARSDRHWTEQRTFDALVTLARENGGRLPSSTQYQKLAPLRDDLPSFATVRNRLGRWSNVRVRVHDKEK